MAETFLTLPELAELLIMSERRVAQLAKLGIIQRSERGRYSLQGSVTGYLSSLSRGPEGKAQLGSDKARLLKAKADIEEIKARALRENLVEREEAELAWQKFAGNITRRVKAIAGEIAPQLVMAETASEATVIIGGAVDDALRDIASWEYEAAD